MIPTPSLNPVTFFVSYSKESDGNFASSLKYHLSTRGFDAFLAHEDLLGGNLWKERIKDKIRECDFFLPILSKNFITSPYCDQEVGMALILQKQPIPVQIDETIPYGFLSDFQSIRIYNQSFDLFDEVLEYIAKQPDMRGRVIPRALDMFGKSNSYNAAGDSARYIRRFEPFNQGEVVSLGTCVVKNNQIQDSHRAKKELEGIFDRHAEHLSSDLSGRLEECGFLKLPE